MFAWKKYTLLIQLRHALQSIWDTECGSCNRAIGSEDTLQ